MSFLFSFLSYVRSNFPDWADLALLSLLFLVVVCSPQRHRCSSTMLNKIASVISGGNGQHGAGDDSNSQWGGAE